MSKFRSIILIIGLLIITVAAALLTVLILYATGTIKTDPIELVLTVEDERKVYDGTPLKAAEYTLTGGELLQGHTLQVEFTGSQTNAGESESDLVAKVVDGKGFDVTKEYAFKTVKGKLTVEPLGINVELLGKEVPYNGKKIDLNDYLVTEGTLLSGHKLVAVSDTVLLEAGTHVTKDDLHVLVYDAFDNDVSENYALEFEASDFEITARPLTIRPKNITKVYDGIEFEATEYEIIGGSLAEGQTVEYIIKTIGDGDPIFANCNGEYGERIEFVDFKIFDGDKEVALTNYKPALNNNVLETGIVKITPRPITVVTGTETFTYDGEAHYNDTVQFVAGSLAPNQTYSVTDPTPVTDVVEGEDNILKLEIFYNGKDVTDNYDPTYIPGKLTVKKCDLTVYTKSYVKEYDKNKTLGDHMNADDANYELSVKLPEKFDISTSYDDAVANQKDFIEETAYKLEVEIYLDEVDCSGNFNINVREGTYAITAKPINIPLSKSLEKEYDGNSYEFDKATVFAGSKLDDYDMTVADFDLIYLDIKSAGTYHYTAEYNGTSKNYDISIGTGTVKITRKAVDLAWDLAYPVVQMDYSGYESYYSDDDYLVDHLTVDGHKVRTAVFEKGGNGPEPDLEHIYVKSVIVYDDEEGDLTPNYDINCADLTITVAVQKCKITLVLPEYSDDYYRPELIAAGVTAMGLASGDRLEVTADCISNDNNSSYWVIENGWKVYHGDKEVTDRYQVTNPDELGKYIII